MVQPGLDHEEAAEPGLEPAPGAPVKQSRLSKVDAVVLLHVGLYQVPELEDARPGRSFFALGSLDPAWEPRDRAAFAGSALRRAARFGATCSPSVSLST